MTEASKTVLSAPVAAAATTLTLAAQSITSNELLDGLSNTSRWLIYSCDYSGQRFSPLTQITPANANQLAAQWTFQTGRSKPASSTSSTRRRSLYEYQTGSAIFEDFSGPNVARTL